jgi:polar amino acid transport system permease protein
MSVPEAASANVSPPPDELDDDVRPDWLTLAGFPYWALMLGAIEVWFAYLALFVDDYNRAFRFLRPGLGLTLQVTFWAFVFAVLIGLVAALGRLSKNPLPRNVARTYIEFIRGVPTLPLIFFMAFVIVPDATSALGGDNQTLSNQWRGIFALSLIYGGYIAEVFRGGIQSVARGQTEAGRSVGMSSRQTMWSIILPQAVRAILPPLGNDFISILKDSSLLSVLAILEITYKSRLYVNSSFQARETYTMLVFLYLTLVLALSLLLNLFERWLNRDQVGAR